MPICTCGGSRGKVAMMRIGANRAPEKNTYRCPKCGRTKRAK